jgi:2'-5' RNA ligase
MTTLAGWAPHHYRPATTGHGCQVCSRGRYTSEHAAALPGSLLPGLPDGMHGKRHPHVPMRRPAAFRSGPGDCAICGLPAANDVHNDPVSGKPLPPDPATDPAGVPAGTSGPTVTADDSVDSEGDEPGESDPDTGDDSGPASAMVGFWLPAALGATLALRGVDTAEEPDDLHLTVAMLAAPPPPGDGAAFAALTGAIATAAARIPPLSVTLSGVGVFTSGDTPVTYYSVDAAALPEVFEQVTDALEDAGCPLSYEHGFTPHITLAYSAVPVPAPPPDPILLTTLTLAVGENRYEFPLTGSTDPGGGDDDGDGDGGPGGFEDLFTASHRRRAHTRARIPAPVPGPRRSGERAFTTFANGRMLITAPADSLSGGDGPLVPPALTAAATGNRHLTWLAGRLVGADAPNRNGALWTSEDLAFGRPSVKHGPVNWLHEGTHVIGTLADAVFVPREQAGDVGAHIASLAGIWTWLYPQETAAITTASDAGRLWQSMECISETVECAGDSGCGRTVSYGSYLDGAGVCTHMRERSAVRRFANPVFLGSAVIVPPVRPGWADADTRVLRQLSMVAADTYEVAGHPDMTASEWERLMGQVLVYAGIGATRAAGPPPAHDTHAAHLARRAPRVDPHPTAGESPTGHPAYPALGAGPAGDSMSALARSIAALTTVLTEERATPRLRTVERDADGFITAIIDR